MNLITPTKWQEQFTKMPKDMEGAYKVVCSHPYHGMAVYYLTVQQFLDNIKTLLVPYWINNYTVMLHPCD